MQTCLSFSGGTFFCCQGGLNVLRPLLILIAAKNEFVFCGLLYAIGDGGIMKNDNTSKLVSLGSFDLSAEAFIELIGYSSFVAVVVSLITPGFVLWGGEGLWHSAVFMLSVSLTSLVVFAFSDYIVRFRCVPLMVFACLGMLAFGLLLCSSNAAAWFRLLLLVFAAIGLGALAPQWFHLLGSQDFRVVPILVAAGLALGLLFVVMMGLLEGSLRLVVACALYATAALCVLALFLCVPERVVPKKIDKERSDKRTRITPASHIMLAMNFFQIATVAALAAVFDMAIPCLLVAIATALVYMFDFFGDKRLSEQNLSQVTSPATTAAYLMLFLFGDPISLGALLLLTFFCTIFTISGYSAMSEHVRMSKLAPFRLFARTRFYDYFCASAGCACGLAIAWAASVDVLLAVKLSATVAVLLCFVSSYCRKSRFPELDILEEKIDPADPYAALKRKCRIVCNRYDLSPRQYDVLVLVAQGRNAKYVQQALTISCSTAQTHIRNIYNKTGVHSRQELLDLVEKATPYEKEK